MGFILHRLDADGDVAIAAGPQDCIRVDTRTGDILARMLGRNYHTDVELVDGGVPFGLHLTPGNPATVALRMYNDDLTVAGVIETPLDPILAYGGRISSGDGLLYWQVGDAVRIVGDEGVLRDVALPNLGSEIGAIGGGFCVLLDAGRRLSAYDSDGTPRWSVVLPVQSRKLVASEKYVVAWSGAVGTYPNLQWPVTVYDATDGHMVYQWIEAGRNIIRDAALDRDRLFVLRSGYRNDGTVDDEIEERNLSTLEVEESVNLGGARLLIDVAGSGIFCVGNDGFDIVPAGEFGTVDQEVPQAAPFDVFLAAHPDLDARTVAGLQMFGDLFPDRFKTAAQYEALLLILG